MTSKKVIVGFEDDCIGMTGLQACRIRGSR